MKLKQIYLLCLRVWGSFLLIVVWILPAFAQTDFSLSPQGYSEKGKPSAPLSPSQGGMSPVSVSPMPPIPTAATTAPMATSTAPVPSPIVMAEETVESAKKTGVPETITIQPVKYTSENLPDPFLSPFEIEALSKNKPAINTEELEICQEELEGFQVTGIVWGAKLPQAIINETVVKIGETLNGASILNISKEGVYVLYEEKKYLLKTPR